MRLFFILLIAACSLAVTARAQDTNLLRTDIELFEAQPDRVIVKGIGLLGSISTVGGVIDVHSRESTDTSTGQKLYAAVFDFNANGNGRVRLFVDYAEMDSLLASVDYVMRVTSDVTTLPSFFAEFTTKSGLHVIAYSSRKQGSVQIFIQFCDFPRIQLTTDQVSQFRDLVSSAKNTLDNLASRK